MSGVVDIGPHRVRVGDLFDKGLGEELFGDRKFDLMYTDPPWGSGTMKWWRTKANKDAGLPIEGVVSAEAMLHRIFELFWLYGKPGSPLLIEYGQRWRDDVIRIGEETGAAFRALAHPVYSSKRLPMDLFLFNGSPKIDRRAWVNRVNGTRGYPTVLAATEGLVRPGGLICDPMCGMGYTARLAVEHGATFIGNELNPVRAEKTIAKLSKRRG